MGRHKNSYTLEERLEKITNEINETESKLVALKSSKKELLNSIKQNQLLQLDQIISERGLSFESVKELLESTDTVSAAS